MRSSVALATVPLLALTACGGSGPATGNGAAEEPEPVQVVGVVQTPVNMMALFHVGMDFGPDEEFVHGETPCKARDDVADHALAGAQVIVKDAGGQTVGTGRLGPGVLGGTKDQPPVDSPCEFAFEVTDVPGGSAFYEVAVAGLEPVTFQANELAAKVTIAAK